MKLLELKSILFCIITVAAISVSLTSCEKPNFANKEQINEITTINSAKGLLLPQEMFDKGEEAILEFIQNLSNEEVALYTNNYKTMKFLKEKGKLAETDDELKEVKNLSKINLSNYLTEQESNELKKQFISIEKGAIGERGCFGLWINNNFCCTICCATHPLYGTSCKPI